MADQEIAIYLFNKEISKYMQMHQSKAGVQNDDLVSGDRGTFQHTNVLPQLKLHALHQK